MWWRKKRNWLLIILGLYLIGVIARLLLFHWDPSAAALFSPHDGFEYSKTYTTGGALGLSVGQTPEEVLEVLERDNLDEFYFFAYKSRSKEEFKANRSSVVMRIDLPTVHAQANADEALQFATSAVLWRVQLSALGPDAPRNYLGRVDIDFEFEQGILTQFTVIGRWWVINT